MRPIRTIEDDLTTPVQRSSGDPAAEWIYLDTKEHFIARAAATVGKPIVQALHAQRAADMPPFPTRRSTTRQVFALINHGRWLWECPICAGGAQVCSKADPRAFCVECLNGGEDAWWPVVFPDDAAEIEAELVKRPADPNRNWSPGETVAALVAENIHHGVEPLGLDSA